MLVGDPRQRNGTGVIEELRTGEKFLGRRHLARLLDLPCMAFRGLLADLLVVGFHGRMVTGRWGNGKGAFGRKGAAI